MPSGLMIARTIPALRRALNVLRARKATLALVPTMGALHDGHVSLVRVAKRRARRVVVSIFVNPTQFAPTEDFGSYPRTWKADVAKLAAQNVDLIWSPDVKAMYPDGFASRILTEGPATAGLEDRFRPHFFGGVTTVVAILLNIVRPHFAFFGQKDAQQTIVIRQMVRDLAFNTEIVVLPIVREESGLALSSRNQYLSEEQRQAATVLRRALMKARAEYNDGEHNVARLIEVVQKTIATEPLARVDYVSVNDLETLEEVDRIDDRPALVSLAAFIGKTRLIDNVVLGKTKQQDAAGRWHE